MALLTILACAVPAPAPTSEVFPWVYTPEENLEPWAEVRWETETWDPLVDTDIAALYLQKAYHHRQSAPVESLDHFAIMREAIPPLGEGTTLSFVGDIMWVGGNWARFAEPAAHLLDGDLRVGNLETPTDPSRSTDSGELGLYRFNAPPEMLDGLPVDVLQLNNNHSMDVEDPGLEATVAEVAARGFVHTGVDGHGRAGDIALLSYTWGINRRDITSVHDLAVVPFGHLDTLDVSRVEADIAATDAATVVVLLHWGFEYEYYPDPHFLQLGRLLVAAGADVVVGSGPHVVQPAEICHVNQGVEPGIGTCAVETEDGEPRTAAILYSLGDFGTSLRGLPLSVGLVATVSVEGASVTGLGWSAAATVEGPEVVPLEEVDGTEFAAEMERLEAHLGGGWRR